jgi:3-phenylpropionate/trans-cinnamate dioxygenase ferredoxin reductase subunit
MRHARRWAGCPARGYPRYTRQDTCRIEAKALDHPVVIVGASHAAAQAVDSLRRDGHAGRIVLVGDEPALPYQRPPLSKKCLAGEMDEERLWIRPAAYYEQRDVELRLGRRAMRLDATAKVLELDGDERLAYGRLLLATGARARAIDVPGAGLAGVHALRTLADVQAIRRDLAPGRRAVIVGAGYIGLECAASLVRLGMSVTVLEVAERVMSRVVAPEMSAFYTAQHRAHGVELLLRRRITAFEGVGHVRAVRCADNILYPADVVIVGIGIVPNVELAADAGIACDNGIAVDEHCETSDPDVFAIGDCASFPSQRYGRRVRLESVDNAFEQAKTAAANLCGRPLVHDKLPWFWSDQYDLKLQIVGLAQGYDHVVMRGDPAGHAFACCYLRGDELLALDAVNDAKDFMPARRLIADRARFDLGRLADPAVPLKEAVA